MIVPAPDLYLIEESEPKPGLEAFLQPDASDEPELPCDACGVLVVWAPELREFLDVATVGPHECRP